MLKVPVNEYQTLVEKRKLQVELEPVISEIVCNMGVDLGIILHYYFNENYNIVLSVWFYVLSDNL